MIERRPFREIRVISICFCLASVLNSLELLAQESGAGRGPEAFAQPLLNAIRSGGGESRLRVVHPLSRRCILPATQPYFDWLFTRQARTAGTGRMSVLVTPIENVATALPIDGRSDYPVRPSHQVQMDIVDGPNSTSSLITYVALDAGQWREVLPCPRGDVLQQATINQTNQNREQERVKFLLANMPVALRNEIQSLLSGGSKIEAIRRYAAETQQDLSTAKAVVESLATIGPK